MAKFWRIETAHLVKYFTDNNQPEEVAKAVNQAGKIAFANDGSVIWFNSPLPALPALTDSTRSETYRAFLNCECDVIECAHYVNFREMVHVQSSLRPLPI